ncbi:MAG: HD-GYP domain-containing protein [Candidatus Omnitrophota bacterium]
MANENTIELEEQPAYRGNFFKYSTLGILFVLIIVQLINAILKVRIIPEIVAMGVAFVCVFYLWIAESQDIFMLQEANLQLLEAQKDLKASHVEAILSLILSQEAKDSYTYGHSERVRQYATVITQEMELSTEEIETVSRAAKLHDIGKIGIKDDVLFCKEILSEDKLEIIRSHPVKGLKILEPLKFLNKEKDIIRHHHERYDGKGYPDGLKGEQIPLGARIICVADSFDAMRTQRPYNDPLSKQGIINELKNNSGTQFDPVVVDAFLKHIDRFYV